MKIVSLLPSATELVYALGLGHDIVGVTDECDHPGEVSEKPVVARSLLPPDRRAPAAADETDAADDPLFAIDEDLLHQLDPDVVLTQNLCKTCAVSATEARAALDRIGSDAEVVVLDPRSLDEVFETFATVGEAIGRKEEAAALVGSLRRRVDAIRATAVRLPSIGVLALEWPDPPWAAGYWIAEMVGISGGANLLSTAKEPSLAVTWKEIADATPEVIAFLPRGSYLEEAEEEARALFQNPDFANTPAAREKGVVAMDATSFFSRPGPRLVDGLEALAWAIHPEAFPEPPAGTATRVER